MYDTLKIWLPTERIAEVGYLSRVPTLLDNPTQHSNSLNTGFTGHYKGMKVTVNPKGIGLFGSVCKAYLNDNIKTLTRQDTERAFEQFSDELLLPINEGIIRRIDFAQSFLVNYEPEIYYNYLGYCNHYDRLTQPHSLYYQNQLRTKLFYNKLTEVKKKGYKVPEVWFNENVLRYELRYLSRLPQQFNVYEVKAKMLYDEVFYIDLIDRWHKEYDTITKTNNINLNYNKMKRPKDFLSLLALLQINQLGLNQTLMLIDEVKAKNCFKHKEYYSRLKADIKRLYKAYEPEKSNELITELNDKIRQVKGYYR